MIISRKSTFPHLVAFLREKLPEVETSISPGISPGHVCLWNDKKSGNIYIIKLPQGSPSSEKVGAAALPTCRVTAKATGCGNVDFPVKSDVPAPGSFFPILGN